MNFASIQSAAKLDFAPAPAPPSIKAQEVLSAAVQQARLKAGEYTKQPEIAEPAMPSATVAHHSQNYCQSKGWARAAGVFDAIEQRSQGKKVLSYREADIAARHDLLSVQVVIDQLMSEAEWMITEDMAGVDCSVYELRRRYNFLMKSLPSIEQTWQRGQDYKKNLYDKQPQEQKDKCDAYMTKVSKELNGLKDEMKDIELHLKSIGLTMWPEELKHGFHINLCRPEYMSEDQYQAKVKSFEVVFADPIQA